MDRRIDRLPETSGEIAMELAAISARLSSLESVTSTSSADQYSTALKAAAPFRKEVETLTAAIDKLTLRLAEVEKAGRKTPVVNPKTVLGIVEPLMDEIVKIEDGLTEAIRKNVSRATTLTEEASAAAKASVKGAEIALTSSFKNFAFGE